MGYQEQLQQWSQVLSNESASIQQQLQHYPKGNLKIYKNGKYLQLYHETTTDNRTVRRRLPRSENQLAQKLAQKRMAQDQLEQLDLLLACLKDYLSAENQRAKSSSSQLNLVKRANKEILHMTNFEEQAFQWANMEYPANLTNPEECRIPTPGGYHVRSKSEAMIADALFSYHLAHRYECKLSLGTITYYPDFMICHPSTNRIYLWEHFGLMDDAKYRKKTMIKLEHYIASGYFPSDNLITTFEDLNHPLELKTVLREIERYFR